MLGQSNGESKVAQVHFHIVVDHDIFWFDISVDNLSLVACLQTVEDLFKYLMTVLL